MAVVTVESNASVETPIATRKNLFFRDNDEYF